MQERIIIIEDDSAVRDSLELLLRETYQLETFDSPEGIIGSQYDFPRLFIIDFQLPFMDGISVCRLLKAQDETKNIPVIVMSANDAFQNAAMEAGAFAVVKKPFKIKDFRALVAEALNVWAI